MDIVNSFEIENEKFYYYDINRLCVQNLKLKKLPIVLKILLEANLRKVKNNDDLNRVIKVFSNREASQIEFNASRVVLDESLGLNTLVDLTSFREKYENINPKIMIDLLMNSSLDEKNKEKYEFVKWASRSFSNLRVIPPKNRTLHPINLEFLSTILHIEKNEDKFFLYPETVLGNNTFGVLGLNVDTIKLKLALLGKDVSISLPKVVGVNVKGKLKDGVLSSDVIKSLKSRLKEINPNGKIIEFYGESLKYLTLEERVKILKIARELNFSSFFFAIDDKTIDYFNKTRGSEDFSNLVKKYLQLQGLFYDEDNVIEYDELITLDLEVIKPNIVKGKRLEDNIHINTLANLPILNKTTILEDNDVVIAAIENFDPYFIIHMALIAKKAHDLGIKINKNIKAFAKVDLECLEKTGLLRYLENIGFVVDSKIDSFDLESNIEADIRHNNLNICSISSCEKAFEYPLIKSNYLMSSSLVVIYSLIGTIKFNLFEDSIVLIDDSEISLDDLWPLPQEVAGYLDELNISLYQDIYKNIFNGNEFWNNIEVESSALYKWNKNSTYLQSSKFFEEAKVEKIEIRNASILALFDDKVSIDQISPKGQISLFSTTAKHLESKGLKSFDFDSFEKRNTNSEVMTRAIFDTTDIHNRMVSKEGSFTMAYEEHEIVSIYEKSQKCKEKSIPLVIFAGSDFGIGEFDEWAVRGIKLLGVKAIIAKSFSDEYRTNLVNYGILPLEFIDDDIDSLKLKGEENITITLDEIKPDVKLNLVVKKEYFEVEIELKCRLDSFDEVEYYKEGGIFPHILKDL